MQKRNFWVKILAGNLLFAFCIVFSFNCSKKASSTSLPANYIPDSVKTFLPAADMDTLESLGMTINTGGKPPSIDGDYYIGYPVLLNSNIPYDEVGQGFNAMSQQFYNQTANLHISEEYISGTGSEISGGAGVFITGTGNNFTVYVPENSVNIVYYNGYYDTIASKSAAVFSGTKTSAGIQNWQMGFVLTAKGPDPDSMLIGVGQSRVIVSDDSLAMAVQSFPYNGIAKTKDIQNLMESFLLRKSK